MHWPGVTDLPTIPPEAAPSAPVPVPAVTPPMVTPGVPFCAEVQAAVSISSVQSAAVGKCRNILDPHVCFRAKS
jgi:hypothetical protein